MPLTQELGFLWVFLEGWNPSLFLEVEFLIKSQSRETLNAEELKHGLCVNRNRTLQYYCGFTESS